METTPDPAAAAAEPARLIAHTEEMRGDAPAGSENAPPASHRAFGVLTACRGALQPGQVVYVEAASAKAARAALTHAGGADVAPASVEQVSLAHTQLFPLPTV